MWLFLLFFGMSQKIIIVHNIRGRVNFILNAEYQDIFNSQDTAVHLEKLSNNNIR